MLVQVDVADNIDLVRIIQEFEEAYEIKYDKKPKLVKRHAAECPAEVRMGACAGLHTKCK